MPQRSEMSLTLHATLRALLLGCVPVALGACTMVGAPAPAPRPAARIPVGGGGAPAVPAEEDAPVAPERITDRVVDVALESIGTPYRWGGTDENGFDCSGLIQFAYEQLGIRVPRTTADQMRSGWSVAPRPTLLRRGDVLGFSDVGAGKTRHVGLYIGADEFIHSSSSGVRISTLRNPYWLERLVSARRIVEWEGGT